MSEIYFTIAGTNNYEAWAKKKELRASAGEED